MLNDLSRRGSGIKKVKLRFMIANPGTPTKKNFGPEDETALNNLVYWLNKHWQHTEAPTKAQVNQYSTCYFEDNCLRLL